MRLILTCLVIFFVTGVRTDAKTLPSPPPIVQVQTQEPREAYGNWEVSKLDGSFLAGTVNASNSAFGVLCADTCAAFFNPQIACDDGHEYPGLVNSSAGAYTVTLRCALVGKLNLFVMSLTDTIIDSMEIGGELGMALPQKSGQFQVSRFSLTGALKATMRAYELSSAGRQKPGEQGLRDQTY